MRRHYIYCSSSHFFVSLSIDQTTNFAIPSYLTINENDAILEVMSTNASVIHNRHGFKKRVE